jgi:hypothetical protein
VQISRRKTAKARERPERKVNGVAVIAQIEDARKPDRGVPGLIPTPVFALTFDKVADTSGNRRVSNLSGSHQAKQRPGRLRGDAVGRFAMRYSGVVGFGAFAPAAVRMLPGEQPNYRSAYFRRDGVDAECIESRQRRPGSIDVVGAPATEPAAIALLFAS